MERMGVHARRRVASYRRRTTTAPKLPDGNHAGSTETFAGAVRDPRQKRQPTSDVAEVTEEFRARLNSTARRIDLRGRDPPLGARRIWEALTLGPGKNDTARDRNLRAVDGHHPQLEWTPTSSTNRLKHAQPHREGFRDFRGAGWLSSSNRGKDEEKEKEQEEEF